MPHPRRMNWAHLCACCMVYKWASNRPPPHTHGLKTHLGTMQSLYLVLFAAVAGVALSEDCGLEVPAYDTFDYEAVRWFPPINNVLLIFKFLSVVRLVPLHPVPGHLPRLWRCRLPAEGVGSAHPGGAGPIPSQDVQVRRCCVLLAVCVILWKNTFLIELCVNNYDTIFFWHLSPDQNRLWQLFCLEDWIDKRLLSKST